MPEKYKQIYNKNCTLFSEQVLKQNTGEKPLKIHKNLLLFGIFSLGPWPPPQHIF